MPNYNEITSYLTTYPELALLLPDICADVRQAFGLQVELSLELYKDPEIDDRYLTMYVRKEKYDRNILDMLQAVNDRFVDRLEGIGGYFLLATDFSRPGKSHAV